MGIKKIAIVDYGAGNTGSMFNMILSLGYEPVKVWDPSELVKYQKIILPGVGSFDNGMSKLKSSGFEHAIKNAANNGNHILGVCLGMQLLYRSSDEGRSLGLGFIDEQIHKFPKSDLPVPHMGWNDVKIIQEKNLFKLSIKTNRFYFVHGYFAPISNLAETLMSAEYIVNFSAAVKKDNIYGVQFHPEKSHGFGRNLLQGFIELDA